MSKSKPAVLSSTLREMLEAAFNSPEGVVRAAAFVTGAFSIPTANALCKRKWLEKIEDPGPRPGRAYRLTPEGRRVAQTIFDRP